MSFGSVTTVIRTYPRIRMRSKSQVQRPWPRQIECQRKNDGTDSNSDAMPQKDGRDECHSEKFHPGFKYSMRLIWNLLLSWVIFLVWFCEATVDFIYPDGELPKVYCKPSVIHNYVLRNCQPLTSKYRCTPLARWGWIQTLSNITRKILYHENPYKRKLFVMKDGGVVGVDWYHKSPPKRESVRPVLLIVPCHNVVALSEDVISEEAYRSGFRPIVFRSRGSHGVELRNPSKFQTFGDSSDLREVVKQIRQLYSRAKIVSVGVGSGAGLLLSYLGDYGSSCHLQAAVCLSPWYSLEDQLSHQNIQTFPKWLLLQSMKWELYQNAQVLQGKVNLDRAFGSSSVQEYLDHVVCTEKSRNRNIEDIYEKEELLRDIDEVAIPLLCVNSLDDPIVKREHIPFDLFETLPQVMLVTTTNGGHSAFLEGWKANNWGINLTLNYFQTVLEVMKQN